MHADIEEFVRETLGKPGKNYLLKLNYRDHQEFLKYLTVTK